MKISMLLASMLLLAGCNTMEGLGKDISAAGYTLERAADRNLNSSQDDKQTNSVSYPSSSGGGTYQATPVDPVSQTQPQPLQ